MDEPRKRWTVGGVFVGDPALEGKEGDELRIEEFRPALGHFKAQGGAARADAFVGTVLSLHFEGNSEYDVLGSAVMVGPGIALAAQHVIAGHIDRLQRREMSAFCVGVADGELHIWTVCKVSQPSTTDIAILSLRLRSPVPKDRTFRRASASTRFPAIGEPLQLVGFIARSAELAPTGADHDFAVTASLQVSIGVVLDRFPKQRDSVMLPWPSLVVDCPAWGGMSGGPVFDQHGYLIGLVCASIDGDPCASVAHVWPALGFPFAGGWPSGLIPTGVTLIDCAPRYLSIQMPEAVAVQLDPDTGQASLGYSLWS